MTSQASSTVKRTAPYAFTGAFSSGIAVAALYGIYMLAVLPILNFVVMIGDRNAIKNPSSELFGTELSSTCTYTIMQAGNIFTPLTIFATIVISILMGIMMFRFITSKKTVNVFYSLGIKRVSLFTSRYMAGLIMIFACVAVPFILSGVVSAAFIGANSKLLMAVVLGILCYFSLAAFCYSLTAAVFSCVGTSIEGVGFTGIILLLPTIFFYCLQNFGSLLLYGSSYSARYYTLASGEYVTSNSLAREFSNLNPIIYITKLFTQYSSAGKFDGKAVLFDQYSESTEWVNPNFLVPILWLVAAALVAVVAMFLFNRRKSEICGFLGMSGVLNFVGSFIAGFGGFTIAVVVLNSYGKILSVVVGSIVLLIIYFGLMLLLKRSFKVVFKKSYLAACQLGASLIILCVFMLGGFGYSSKLPNVDKVKSVQVSSVAVDSMISKHGSNSSSYYDEESALSVTLNTSLTGDYTSKEDVKKILALHSKFISLGSANLKSDEFENVTMMFRYVLKNGKVFTRYYTRADAEALKMCLALDETDKIKQDIKETYSMKNPDKTVSFNLADYGKIDVIAVNSLVNRSSFNLMKVSSKQYSQLLAVLADDLTSQTWEQRYTPEKAAIGAIWFRSNENTNVDGAEIQKTDSETFSQAYFPSNSYGSKVIYITDDMVKTLAFLENNGFMDFFHAADVKDIESVSFRKAAVDRQSWSYVAGSAISLEIIAHDIKSPGSVGYVVTDGGQSISTLTEQNTIKDKEKIAKLLPTMHMRYFTFETGYICYIRCVDGSTVTKYITESDAPDYVKYFSYK